MGKKRRKLMGPVVYFLIIEAKSYQAGKPPLKDKLGPYGSMKEAESKKREEEEARGIEGYEYEYRIEPVPAALLSK
jgi:hypothetical protein